MSFSSIADMLSAVQERTQPLYAVIRDADCLENGYDAAASHRQIAALWAAMQASSRQYCADDRSNSGLIGGDAEKLRAAAEKGLLLGGTYFQRVTEQALKVAECNACMKRIVAAPTAGSCGVLPAVLIPLTDERDVPEETILQALYIAPYRRGYASARRTWPLPASRAASRSMRSSTRWARSATRSRPTCARPGSAVLRAHRPGERSRARSRRPGSERRIRNLLHRRCSRFLHKKA